MQRTRLKNPTIVAYLSCADCFSTSCRLPSTLHTNSTNPDIQTHDVLGEDYNKERLSNDDLLYNSLLTPQALSHRTSSFTFETITA